MGEDKCAAKTAECDAIDDSCDTKTGKKAKKKCNMKLKKCRKQEKKICDANDGDGDSDNDKEKPSKNSLKNACTKLKKKCKDVADDAEKAVCLATGAEVEE